MSKPENASERDQDSGSFRIRGRDSGSRQCRTAFEAPDFVSCVLGLSSVGALFRSRGNREIFPFARRRKRLR